MNKGEVWFVEFPLEEDESKSINRPVIVLDENILGVLSVKITKHKKSADCESALEEAATYSPTTKCWFRPATASSDGIATWFSSTPRSERIRILAPSLQTSMRTFAAAPTASTEASATG